MNTTEKTQGLLARTGIADMTTQKDIIIEQLSFKHGIDVKADDFHALRSEQVEGLLHWAKAYGYRKPKNANGSKARCFFTMLQRYANKVN